MIHLLLALVLSAAPVRAGNMNLRDGAGLAILKGPQPQASGVPVAFPTDQSATVQATEGVVTAEPISAYEVFDYTFPIGSTYLAFVQAAASGKLQVSYLATDGTQADVWAYCQDVVSAPSGIVWEPVTLIPNSKQCIIPRAGAVGVRFTEYMFATTTLTYQTQYGQMPDLFASGVGQGKPTTNVDGPMVQGSVNTSAPTYTDATVRALSLKTNGDLRVSNADALAFHNSSDISLNNIELYGLNLSGASGLMAATAPTRGLFIGGEVDTGAPGTATDGHMMGFILDALRRLVVTMNGTPENVVQNRAAVTDTTETTVLTAVASTCLDIVSFDCYNHSTTDSAVEIRDATGGTVRRDPFLIQKGGVVMNFTTPFKQTTANNNWTMKFTTTPAGGGAKGTCTFQAVKRGC